MTADYYTSYTVHNTHTHKYPLRTNHDYHECMRVPGLVRDVPSAQSTLSQNAVYIKAQMNSSWMLLQQNNTDHRPLIN